MRTLAAIGAGLAMLVLGATLAVAATPDTPYDTVRMANPDPEPQGRFGDRMRSAGDLNGDGVPDLWLGQYGYDQGASLENVGRVYAISGRDRSVIYAIDSPDPQHLPAGRGGFGWAISNVDDIDGDGVAELLVGSPRHDADSNVNQGRAWLYSGAANKPKTPLLTLDNPAPQGTADNTALFGYRLGKAGDLNGDGKPELLIGAPGNDGAVVGSPAAGQPAGCGDSETPPQGCRRDQGQAFIFDGATGALIRTLDMPPGDRYLEPSGVCMSDAPGPAESVCGELGIAAQGPGDATGDGVPDQLISAWSFNPGTNCGTPQAEGCFVSAGAIYLFSGATGDVVFRIDNPTPESGGRFGLQEVAEESPGDLNQDGHADLYGNGFQQAGPSRDGQPPLAGEGRSWVFSGRDGSILHTLFDPTPEAAGNFGYSLAKTDYDRDGRPDMYIGSFAGSYVFHGQDASLLKNFDLPDSEFADQPPGNTNLGRSTAAPGDLNGDCEPDYVAGSPGHDVDGNRDQGRLYFFLSSGPYACPAAVPPPAPTPPAPVVGTCGDPGAAGYLHPAKMRVLRARVLREDRRLDVLAPITSRARGAEVKVTYQGDNRRDTFEAEVTASTTALDHVRFKEPITRGQARLGTGIVNLEYLGDEDTRPEFVRLRAASQRAELDVEEISLIGDRLSAEGSVTDRAQGVVRLLFSYVDPDGTPNVHEARAEIQDNGDWDLEDDQVPAQLAQCGGYLSIQFTGYFERRIRGEQLAYELNAGQTRTP